MKSSICILSLLMTFISQAINATCCFIDNSFFYIKVGSGVSFSQSAPIFASPLTWNPALEGYDSNLGNRTIGDLSIGCECMQLFDLEANISTRSTFEYRKFQTPVDGGASYTREFDLDVTPILFSICLMGRNLSCTNWDFFCGKVYPIIGVSVGISNLLITNFRTTGLAPSGDSAPFLSFSAENQYTLRKNFTYSALIGLEYNFKNRWAFATGYRWLDAGKFDGPRFFRVATGAAVDVGDQAWKIQFKSNEWFLTLKIYL